jgi:uncharacterized protein YqeY
VTAPGDANDLRARLRRALPPAIKARDQTAVAALRSALAAIDNAEAVEAGNPPPPAPRPAPAVAGAVVGLGAGEVERRRLTAADTEAIVRREVSERRTAARAYQEAGRPEQAERLRAEADLLGGHLGDPETPA